MQKTILIADDDPEIRETLRCLLECAGYVTVEASDGAEALAAVRGMQFDLLITDVQMPELDGLELLEALRYRQQAPRVIAISGAWDGVCLPVASKLGAFAALHKPWRKEELLDLVREALQEQTAPTAA